MATVFKSVPVILILLLVTSQSNAAEIVTERQLVSTHVEHRRIEIPLGESPADTIVTTIILEAIPTQHFIQNDVFEQRESLIELEKGNTIQEYVEMSEQAIAQYDHHIPDPLLQEPDYAIEGWVDIDPYIELGFTFYTEENRRGTSLIQDDDVIIQHERQYNVN